MAQNKHFTFEIKKGTIETAVAISEEIPELTNPYQAEEYQKRLTGVPHIILVAWRGTMPIGFKIGYEREGYFYSWMGGVLPGARRNGIAQALADEQEEWARSKGYPSVTFKTLNRHKAMLAFSLYNGFNIIKVEERDSIADYRIWLRKELV